MTFEEQIKTISSYENKPLYLIALGLAQDAQGKQIAALLEQLLHEQRTTNLLIKGLLDNTKPADPIVTETFSDPGYSRSNITITKPEHVSVTPRRKR